MSKTVTEENCPEEHCNSCPLHGSCSKEQQINKVKMLEGSSAKHIIGVVSGKGGVGKSFTTSFLACNLARLGFKVGILDADITGPSIPTAFGSKYKVVGDEDGKNMYPGITKGLHIELISSNMLLDDITDPIVWRGPLIGDLVIQFFNQVYWGKLDYLLIDMPPGTGDVALSAFQKIPLDGLVLVTTPQELVSIIVEKAAKMAKMMNIPILGLISNMSYLVCPHCFKRIDLYGKDHLEEIAQKLQITNVAKLPFNPDIPNYVDKGLIENFNADFLAEFTKKLIDVNDGK